MISEPIHAKPIEIRLVKIDDLQELCTLSRQTFIDAFTGQNKEENITHFIKTAFTATSLGDQLKNTDSLFYFAIEATANSVSDLTSAYTGKSVNIIGDEDSPNKKRSIEEIILTQNLFTDHSTPSQSTTNHILNVNPNLDIISSAGSIPNTMLKQSPNHMLSSNSIQGKNHALGYIKINFGTSQSELQDEQALELERIYVSNDQLGKGIGQQLLDKAIETAQIAGLKYIWLGVWEHNLRARRFYDRNGFVQFDKHIFTLGDDDQIDLLMKKIL